MLSPLHPSGKPDAHKGRHYICVFPISHPFQVSFKELLAIDG